MTRRPPSITDPAKTIERCYERLAWSERMLADYEARGWAASARAERRKIAGLKGAITRATRLIS